MRRVLLGVSLCALLFVSCAEEPAENVAPAGAQGLSVEASNYQFEAPDEVESGAVEITMTNAGPEPHQAQLYKLNDGMEIGDLVKASMQDDSVAALAKTGVTVGGPNGVDKGETQVATVDLDPGQYAFTCLIPDPKGRAHLALGMVAPLEVTAGDEEAELPDAEYVSSATEYKFKLPTAWQGEISFTNKGKEDHDFQVLGIAPGKTAADVEASFEGPPEGSGPPPWTADGGGAVIAPGQTETFELDLKPGTYFAVCFVAALEKKAPHFALGMMQKFEVKV